MEFNLQIGEEYTQKELESIFETGLGSQLPGILPKKPGEVIKQPYVFLFSKYDNRYGDRMEGKIIYYVGFGKKEEDQKMIRGNLRLAESEKEGRIIFGFKKEKNNIGWTYIGILRLLDVLEGENDLGKKIFEFKLESTGIASPFDVKDAIEYIEDTQPSLTSDNEPKIQNVKRKARSVAFSDDVKKIYDYQCAVCKIKRLNKKGKPEVEAAHIYPKEKNGPDKVINGISLCRLHHWAFDNGLLAISDNYEVIVPDWIKNDENYEDIYKLEGYKVILPTNNQFQPHKIYLEAHRKMHGLN